MEYLPIYKPGQAMTFKASAAITGGQLLVISGDNTVAPSGAGSTAVVGVAAFDAAVNDNLTVYAGGVQVVEASGAITAGSPVISGAAGTVAASALPPDGQQVGIATEAAAAAAQVRVQFGR